MNTTLRNIVATLIGIIIGGAVNMGIVQMSGKIIPPPPGADFTTVEGLNASMHLMQPKHFIMPFLAHALGTLVAAIIACYFAVGNKLIPAAIVGLLFLVGGIMAVRMIPAPIWFDVLDLTVAYIPMAWLGMKLAAIKKSSA